ncbi:hypothetical protein [Ekhidna sp.]
MKRNKNILVVFLTLIGLLNFSSIISGEQLPDEGVGLGYTLIISPFITLFVAGMFYALLWFFGKLNSNKSVLVRPKLGRNIFDLNQPLELLFVLSIVGLVTGLSIILSHLILNGSLSSIGMMSISYSLGLLLTIWFVLKKGSQKE